MVEMRKRVLNLQEKEACRICAHGILSPDGETVLCVKTGIRQLDSSCRSFKYDPLKRVPERAPTAGGFTKEDFEL